MKEELKEDFQMTKFKDQVVKNDNIIKIESINLVDDFVKEDLYEIWIKI